MNSTINKYVNAVKSLPLRSRTDTVVPISFPVKQQHGLDRYSLLLNPTNSKIQHIFTERHALIPLIPRMSSIAFIKSLIGVHSSYIFVSRRVVVSKAYAGRTNAIFLVTMEGGKGFEKARYPC